MESNFSSAGCTATKHAYKRAKQRLGWSKSALNNMMPRAHELGMKQRDANAVLRKFFKKLRAKSDQQINNIRIYGQVVYFFHNHVLVTVYQIPTRYNRYLQV